MASLVGVGRRSVLNSYGQLGWCGQEEWPEQLWLAWLVWPKQLWLAWLVWPKQLWLAWLVWPIVTIFSEMSESPHYAVNHAAGVPHTHTFHTIFSSADTILYIHIFKIYQKFPARILCHQSINQLPEFFMISEVDNISKLYKGSSKGPDGQVTLSKHTKNI